MEYINVRQLLSNYEASTEKLPVTVTRFGKPIFRIESVGEVVVQKDIQVAEERQPLLRCKAPGCFAEATAVGKVYNDGEWVEVEMCQKHAAISLREFVK